MKESDKKPMVVTVDRDLYDSMVAAFRRVKAERMKNKILSEKLDRQIASMGSDMDSFSARVSEITLNANNLNQAVQMISDLNLKAALGEKTDALVYSVLEMEDRVSKMRNKIMDIREELRPMREYIEGGGPVSQRDDKGKQS